MSKNNDYLKDHYNNFVYPPPDNVLLSSEKPLIFEGDPTVFWSRLFPERKFSKDKLLVLIAGCGTREAAVFARANPNHDFIGIDLSEKSIEHQKELIDKYKLTNLKLICNDFRKEKFNEKFDYIVSFGVIHHLEDPASALIYFNEILKDNGVIALMVYGDKINHAINKVKKIFNHLNLGHDQYAIDFAKQLFTKLNPSHPAKIQADNSFDMKQGGAAIVDFCLHKSEKFYSIKELIKLLDENGFVIKNLNHGYKFALTKFFYGDAKIGNKDVIDNLRSLNIEDQLELGQILNWDDRKVSIICTKVINKKNSIIYNLSNYKNFYCGQNLEIKYNVFKGKLDLKFAGNQFISINIPLNTEEKCIKILQGKNTIGSILDEFTGQDKIIYDDIIRLLVENYLIDLSFHPFNF